jgi:hypothetical protein
LCRAGRIVVAEVEVIRCRVASVGWEVDRRIGRLVSTNTSAFGAAIRGDKIGHENVTRSFVATRAWWCRKP